MERSNEDGEVAVRANRLRLVETILPAVAHEISNNNQTVLLTAQVFQEIWPRLKSIADLYWKEHGDFSVGGLEYSAIREELAEYLANILRSAEKTDRILKEVRTLVRSENLPARVPLDLNRQIEGAVALLANQVRKTTDHLRLDLAAGLPQIRGQVQGIQRLLLNLICNACQALSDKSQGILIRTRHEEKEGWVTCEIADQGRGMEPSVLEGIRELLGGPEARTSAGGTGLAAVRSIVNEHRGRVGIQSEEGNGTRVVLSFPIEGAGG